MKNEPYKYDFAKISNRLKDDITQRLGIKRVYDKGLAHELCISPAYYAVAKKRQKVLFEEILLYCNKYDIDANWIFFGNAKIVF